MAAKLRAVPASAAPTVDIYAADRKRIEERDWAAVHIAGDRAKALPSWFGKRR
ncbi:MAG TPA: hypothetical protein VFJ46_17730 [Xanthobacteraceae bacterium]|nr:hypothetical protein [Xanthobacteraceae bacterium]